MATEKKQDNEELRFEQKMAKCNEIEDIGERNECKIRVLEEELVSIRKKVYPMEDFVHAVKEYAEPKFNALGVRMGNVETTMTNTDTKITNMDTKITNLDSKFTTMDDQMGKMDTKITNLDNRVGKMDTKITNLDNRMGKMEDTITKGFEDLKKGQAKIAKEPPESLYK